MSKEEIDDHEIGMARQKEILAMKDDAREILEQQLRQRALHHGFKMGWPVYELYDRSNGQLIFTGSLFEVEEFLELGY